MNHDSSTEDTAAPQGATAVITHRIRPGKQPEYDAWLKEIGPVCQRFPGYLDLHIVRPIAGLTMTYTVVIRFDTRDHLSSWLHSDERQRLIDQVSPYFATKDDFFIRSGLDFWFTPGEANAKVPTRWKQFLVTWSAIYPMVLFVPLLLVPALSWLGFPPNRYLTTLCVSGTMCFLMIYVVMPRYTKLIQRWLFR